MRDYMKTRIPIFINETGISLDDLFNITEQMILERNLKPKQDINEMRMRRIEEKIKDILSLMEKEGKRI